MRKARKFGSPIKTRSGPGVPPPRAPSPTSAWVYLALLDVSGKRQVGQVEGSIPAQGQRSSTEYTGSH